MPDDWPQAVTVRTERRHLKIAIASKGEALRPHKMRCREESTIPRSALLLLGSRRRLVRPLQQLGQVNPEVTAKLIQDVQLNAFRGLVVQPSQSAAVDAGIPRNVTDLELPLPKQAREVAADHGVDLEKMFF